jgi:hypothetical protein
MSPSMTSRLDTIAAAQKKTRARDLLFACCVALAAAITVTTFTSAPGSNITHVTQR